MKKQQKQLFILIIILFLVGIVLWGVEHYNQVQSQATAEDTDIVVADVTSEEIQRLTYDYDSEHNILVKKQDVWYDEEEESLSINQTLVENMLASISPLKAVSRIDDVTDLEQYGLKNPQRTISFETASQTYQYQVGDYNSVSGIYYLKEPESNTVYVVSSVTVTRFNKSLEDLVESAEEKTE